MELWLAGLIAFIGMVILALILAARRKRKKRWMIAAAIAAALILMAALAYIFLAFVFLDAARNQPPDTPTLSAIPATAPMYVATRRQLTEL